MTPRHKFPSIRDVGLKQYLDERKDIHNTFGYKEFAVMVKTEVNVSNMAKAFSVTRHTIGTWLSIFDEEQQSRE